MASTFGTSGSWGGGGSRQAAMRFRRLQLLASATDAQLDTKFDKAGGEISGDLEVVGRTVLGDVKIEGETEVNKRIYQELNPDPSWNSINGYYGLAKDFQTAISNAAVEKALDVVIRPLFANDIRCITWSPELGKFVAVINNGQFRVLTSYDGINWNNVTAPLQPLVFVKWISGLKLFVAVGNQTIMTSPDGDTWNVSTGITPVNWNRLAYSPQLNLVVVTARQPFGPPFGISNIMLSTDGITYNSLTTDPNEHYQDIIWADVIGKFIINGYYIDSGSAFIKISNDGINWTNISAPWAISFMIVIAWSDELNLLVVTNGLLNYVSNDLINWTSVNYPSAPEFITPVSIGSISWNKDLKIFIQTSTGGTENRLIISPDGFNWSLIRTGKGLINSILDPLDATKRTIICDDTDGLIVGVRVISLTTPSNIPFNTNIASVVNSTTFTITRSLVDLTANSILIADNPWTIPSWSSELSMFVCGTFGGSGRRLLTSSLNGRPPTSYNVFDSPSNRIDQLGNWTIQQVLKAGTYTAGATTPSVAGAKLLVISNASPTEITNFTGGVANQCLTLVFDNDNTVILSNTNIRLAGGAAFTGSQYDTLQLVFIVGQGWLELRRSVKL